VKVRSYQTGHPTLPDEETQACCFYQTCGILKAAAYVPYEVSSFACEGGSTPGHNRKNWDHIPYLGLRPGAHSFDGSRGRHWNLRDLSRYLQDLATGNLLEEGQETLTGDQLSLF
jgi:coproporphyrinogen III oxidase-like Fe-S oxidoreductase